MTTELMELDNITEENAPAIYVSGGLQKFIDRVRNEVSGEVPDLSTKKGRDRIASLAAKVSRSKTAVEKPGRDYLRKLKAMPRVVETELREFVTAMEAIQQAGSLSDEQSRAIVVAIIKGRVPNVTINY